MTRWTVLLALGLTACASAPIAPPAAPAPPTYEQKLAWILELEDQRVLRDPSPSPPPAPAPPPVTRGRTVTLPAPLPPPVPDLVRFATDGEARVRRRAALAIGRVRLEEGVAPLLEVLRDHDPEVRQMAAFALGLIGDRRALPPLIAALSDPAAVVKGSAAEALGLLGDTSAIDPIVKMATAIVESGALATSPPDDQIAMRDTPAAAVRLALYALVRLRSFDGVAAIALDGNGQPRVKWWPVAFALQRLEDRRALPALLALLDESDSYTKAFAAKGLGAMNDARAVAPLLPLVHSPSRELAVEAIRSLGRLRARAASAPLVALIQSPDTEMGRRLEALAVIGAIGGVGVDDLLIDLLGDRRPRVRAAAIRALAELDAEGFITILSGLDLDQDWTVRVALANVLATVPPEAGLPRLRTMLTDSDPRVVPAVLRAIARLKPPDLGAILLEQLRAADAPVRTTAAELLAELRPPDGAVALVAAYDRDVQDSTYTARAAALAALRAYGAEAATPTLTKALEDKDWAVRVRAAKLLSELAAGADVAGRIRPAPPTSVSITTRLVSPPFSTEAYIETTRGTIRLELAVLDAPLTVANFVELSRRGFYNGVAIHRVVPDFVVQAGDPRGDSEGGPGYTIRDEINQRPYLRGTVGMALDWEDTGGSQFFITHSPQPHLDTRYTVFGRVLEGMEIVDRLEVGDVIQRIRIWDGETN